MSASPPAQADRAGLRLASWGRRLAAYLLDELIALWPFLVVVLVATAITAAAGDELSDSVDLGLRSPPW